MWNDNTDTQEYYRVAKLKSGDTIMYSTTKSSTKVFGDTLTIEPMILARTPMMFSVETNSIRPFILEGDPGDYYIPADIFFVIGPLREDLIGPYKEAVSLFSDTVNLLRERTRINDGIHKLLMDVNMGGYEIVDDAE